MKYKVQSNWSYSTNESHWKTISSSRAGYQEFDDLKVALRVFQANANMARCIAPMRVIDSEGVIYADYNPERDTRLPGPDKHVRHATSSNVLNVGQGMYIPLRQPH
jgi:hypothetical protein